MATDRLTDRAVKTQKPRERPYLVPDGRGLYSKVQPGDARSWRLRYQLAGRVHDLGLGTYPEITLAEARHRALEVTKGERHRPARGQAGRPGGEATRRSAHDHLP
jgi:hypothetical protein